MIIYLICISYNIRDKDQPFTIYQQTVLRDYFMPLEESVRNTIHDYCIRDLPGDIQWHTDQFSFIDNIELKKYA